MSHRLAASCTKSVGLGVKEITSALPAPSAESPAGDRVFREELSSRRWLEVLGDHGKVGGL